MSTKITQLKLQTESMQRKANSSQMVNLLASFPLILPKSVNKWITNSRKINLPTKNRAKIVARKELKTKKVTNGNKTLKINQIVNPRTSKRMETRLIQTKIKI